MKPKKKAGALSHSRPAAKKKVSRVRAKEPVMTAMEAAQWTPLLEERREGGGPAQGVDSRREVDRAKESKGEEDESGGPDA